MNREMILSALASLALVTAGTAAAKPGKALDNGPKVGAKAKGKLEAGGRVKIEKSRLGIAAVGEQDRSTRRAKSKGPAHASPRALQRASSNSVLAGQRVVDGQLTGLEVGTPVHVNGVRIGTVERIVPAERQVSNVLVRTISGRIIPISPGKLNLKDGVWNASLRPGGD